MLASVGLIEEGELPKILAELDRIAEQIEAGNFEIEEGIEDVHSQIEFLLTQKLGDIGKKIHSARSRNDQVLVDIKLFLRNEVTEIAALVKTFFDTLQKLSKEHQDKLLPGYTHFQIAMPSSFGLWFGAYAEALVDDLEMLLAAYKIVNKNPLGSGAGYGSSFPINRTLTTELLGFETMNYNVVYAQMTRGKSEKTVATAIAAVAHTLSKFAYDVCLYMNQNFGFITFPDTLTTGSSIMPHKKNPDIFELIRGKCNILQALPNDLTLLTNNLPSGYHREMQLTKEVLFPAISTLKDCLSIAEYTLNYIQIKDNLLEDPKYQHIFSVENVNEKVLQGKSFRDAYVEVGQSIESKTFEPNKNLSHMHEGSIGNLCNEEIEKEFLKVYGQFS
jgi:argininosuccinate lyase